MGTVATNRVTQKLTLCRPVNNRAYLKSVEVRIDDTVVPEEIQFDTLNQMIRNRNLDMAYVTTKNVDSMVNQHDQSAQIRCFVPDLETQSMTDAYNVVSSKLDKKEEDYP